MGEYTPGPCSPWVSVDEFLTCCSEVDESTSREEIERALRIASNTLYLMSGKQFRGTCEIEVEVLPENCRNHLADKYENEIELGYWPITKLVSIKFDGIEQLPERDEETDEFVTDPNFQINDYKFIEKLDGKWPVQRGETPQEVTITFQYGVKPPLEGEEAVKIMAQQVLDACLKKNCDLPDRAGTIVRRGVTITKSDYKLLAKDFVGISMVDQFLQAVNPTKMRVPSFVVRPGQTPKTRRKNT